jgi:hypothetical protein
VDPALGAGVGGSGATSAAGASCITTSSGSFTAGGATAGSAVGGPGSGCDGAGELPPDQDHSQELREGADGLSCAGLWFGVSTGFGASCSCACCTSWSAALRSEDSASAGVLAGAGSNAGGAVVETSSVVPDLPNHPNHPDAGLWGADSACACCSEGDSTGCSGDGSVLSRSWTASVITVSASSGFVLMSFFAASSVIGSAGSGGRPLGIAESSTIFGIAEPDEGLSLMLIASAGFLDSNRLRSTVPFGLEVPPSIVSRATCVDAADLGTRGHDPYQLRVL